MKKILLFISVLYSLASQSQSKGYLRYDSLYIIKVGGNAELILENGTKGVTGGVLVNSGNGRTSFVNLDTSGKWINKITRIPGRDSIIFYIGGVRYAIKDSVGAGSGGSLKEGPLNEKPTTETGFTIENDSLFLQTASHLKPGINSRLDKKRIDKGGIQYSTSSQISPGGYYQGFPSPTSIKDTIYTTFKRGHSHTGAGWVPLFRSADGGRTWDSINVVMPLPAGSGCVTTALNDTIFFAAESLITGRVIFKYSADKGRTIVTTDSIAIAAGNTIAFGKFIELPSGKKMVTAYYFNASDYNLVIFESQDGIDWAQGATIGTGDITTEWLNELWMENLTPEADTDAETQLMVIARDEELNGFVFFTSSDGGDNWSRLGRLPELITTDDTYGYPAEIKLYGGKLYVFVAPRTNKPGPSGAPDFHVAYLEADPALAFTDTTAWSTPRRIANAEINYSGKGINIDFGYFFSYELPGFLGLIGNDVSPLNIYGDDTTRLRIFSIPVFGLDMAEVYASTNQSISANTETLVTLPNVWLDDGLFNSTDNKIDIKADGAYHIQYVTTFQIGTDGTYRKAFLKVENPGYATADRVIGERIIQSTNNLEFLRIEVSEVEYLRAGERVGLYVQSDAATELRNQSEQKYRATIKLKKL